MRIARAPLVLAIALVLAATIYVLTMDGEQDALEVHGKPADAADRSDQAESETRAPDSPAVSETESERSATAAPELDSAEIALAQAARVRGRVIDEEGDAVVGASVTIDYQPADDFNILDLDYGHQATVVGEALTDEEGAFAMEVPRDWPLRLYARAEGRFSALLEDVFAGAEVVIVLGPSTTLLGRITRALDGSPVEAVELSISLLSGPILATAESSADGSYRLSELPAGLATLRIQCQWLADPAWTQIELPRGGRVVHDVALEEGIAIHGTVSDARTSAPIAGAEIGAGWTFGRSVRSDPAGEYELRGFGGPDEYEICVRAPGYADARHEFPYTSMPAERTQLDFALVPGRRARGRVVDPAARPVEGAYVAAVGNADRGEVTDWKSARTDSEGRFLIESLSPERKHALFIRATGWANLVYSFPTDEIESEELDLGTITLQPPGTIEGLVVTEDGAPIADVQVGLRGANADSGALLGDGSKPVLPRNLDWRGVDSDSSGRFRFGDLPAGVFEISARRSSGLEGPSQLVGIFEGERRTDVRIVFPGSGEIRGTVETPDGRGLAGLTVTALAEGREVPRLARRPSAVSQEGGSFRFEGLDAESYTLFVDPRRSALHNAEGFAFTRLAHVRPGEERIVIMLAEPDTLAGQAFTAESLPATDAWVFADLEGEQVGLAASDAEGRFQLTVPRDCMIGIRAFRMETADTESGYQMRKDVPVLVLAPVPAGSKDLVLRFESR